MALIVTEIKPYSKTLIKISKHQNFVKNSKSKTPKFAIKKSFFLQNPGNVLPMSLGSCM